MLACVASAKGKGKRRGGGRGERKTEEGDWGGEKGKELPSLLSSPVPLLHFSLPPPPLFTFALATQATYMCISVRVNEVILVLTVNCLCSFYLVAN